MNRIWMCWIGWLLAALITCPGVRAQGDHAHEEGHVHAGEERVEDAHGHENEHEGGHGEEGAIALEPEVMEEFGIQVEEAGPGVLPLRTTLAGEIIVNRDRVAHIVPRYPGLVIEVKKHIGDRVRENEVLAVIESNESLAHYELRSLIDGTIIEKHIALGEAIGEGDVVFVVADLSTVWVDLTLYQRDLQTVEEGQRVVLRGGHALPEAEGTIAYVSPTLDPHTRTARARVVLPNPDGRWKPGLFISGEVETGTIEAGVLVPPTALQTVDGEQVVFVETHEGFVPRPVRAGRTTREGVEILGGLHAGERYVSRGGFSLKAELARGALEHAGHAH